MIASRSVVSWYNNVLDGNRLQFDLQLAVAYLTLVESSLTQGTTTSYNRKPETSVQSVYTAYFEMKVVSSARANLFTLLDKSGYRRF